MTINVDGPTIRVQISNPAPRCALFVAEFPSSRCCCGAADQPNGTGFSLMLGQICNCEYIDRESQMHVGLT